MNYYQYCSNCGEKNDYGQIDGNIRYHCPICKTIHYQNPNAVVGTLPYCGDRVLLCKRAIEPRKGLWTLPAGFLEMGETLQEGALRETKEETNSTVKIDDIYFMFDIPQIGQFYALYKASIEENSYSPTTESLEVELFSYDEIPWEELAFPFVPIALEQFYEDLSEGYFPLRIRELIKK